MVWLRAPRVVARGVVPQSLSKSCTSQQHGRVPRLHRLQRVEKARSALLESSPVLTRTSSSKAAELARPNVAYELVQGALVRWSELQDSHVKPPTAVLLHGILGSRKNMVSYAQRIVEGFPAWQCLLVDLRCHGETEQMLTPPRQPHGVESAAGDVLKLLRDLRLFPEVLIGHSFGGKVVMSMAQQFGLVGMRLPRPVKVWVLDALPGEVRAGDAGRRDHPADLIARLQQLRMPLRNRSTLHTYLLHHGFSDHIARWASTNLRPAGGDTRALTWSFNLAGIREMYESYEEHSLWEFLQAPAEGIQVNFVRAEHSTFRWGGRDQDRIVDLGHTVHVLENAGHWVHTDNPHGLFKIMQPAFAGAPAMKYN